MNTAQDLMNRHGVLPASASRGRKKAAEPVTGPIWLIVQVGDTILVEGDSDVADGEHVVHRIDDALTISPDAAEIRVKGRRDSNPLIYNRTVKAITKRNGKAFTVTQAMIDAAIADKPVWERVEKGDRVRIEGESDSINGIREVSSVDSDRFNGPDSSGVSIKSWGFVTNSSVKEIMPADAATGIAGQAARVVITDDASETWTFDRVKAEIQPGMRIEVKGDTTTSYSVIREDGVYEVDYIDRSDSHVPVRVKFADDTLWVKRTQIVRIVPASAVIMPVRGEFLIHVDVSTIMSNRSNSEHKAVTVTRRLSDPTAAHLARELAWDGPTRFVHHEFMKIEGTDIQNWVETDSPVTCWRDTGLEVMTPKPDMVVNPMTKPILGAFVIHIAAPVLMKNRAEGRNDPVIAVRQAYTNWATDVHFARRVEWSGPTRMVHRPTTPVPGTNGRGVAFLETDAELTLFMDGREPMVLRMPQRQAVA